MKFISSGPKLYKTFLSVFFQSEFFLYLCSCLTQAAAASRRKFELPQWRICCAVSLLVLMFASGKSNRSYGRLINNSRRCFKLSSMELRGNKTPLHIRLACQGSVEEKPSSINVDVTSPGLVKVREYFCGWTALNLT